MMTQKPLLLKDYLELDPNSDSFNSFASFPRKPDSSTTVRFFLEINRCRGAKLIRSCSKGSTVAKIFNAVKNFPLSSSQTRSRPDESSVKKLISKKFWRKKKKKEDHKVTTVKDIVRLNSFELYGERTSLYFPSPAVSSCSSCSGSESFLSSSSGISECFSGRRRSSSSQKSPSQRQSSEEVGSQKIEHRGCGSEEEKEQLSPVSVMDFPYQDEGDEDDGEDEETAASSPCFERNLANIERATQQLLQKIRQFENLAELDPLDLHISRFACLEDDEITSWDLIQRLRTDCHVGPYSEKLLVDFFVEGLPPSTSTESADVERLLSAARDWINGGGCLEAEERGKAQLDEMERDGRCWCFEQGKGDVAADVEIRVLESLLNELVLDLLAID